MNSRGLSHRAAAVAVLVAFAVGLIGALALRTPPGTRAEGKKPSSGSQFTWKLPTAYGTHLPALGDNVPWVAERVGEITGGSLTLKVFERKPTSSERRR